MKGEVCKALSQRCPEVHLACLWQASSDVPFQKYQEISMYTLLFQIKPRFIKFPKAGEVCHRVSGPVNHNHISRRQAEHPIALSLKFVLKTPDS